ncbi:MAG: gluconate 2-dehydrogenase subunit 3 family protein [Steroidobacteraceae bacterium]
MDRRTTVKWVLAAGAAWPLLERRAAQAGAPLAAHAATHTAHGYGTDPNLVANYHPGELWPLTLTAGERRLAGILADIIIPADEHSPSASAVGLVEFVDEWVSAPYPAQQRDRTLVLGGFAWLDAEAGRRFGKEFADLDPSEQHGICEDICDESRAAAERRDAARFFALYRDLTAGAFYSSPAGRKDLSYIGNVPLARFDGPPPALLQSLGLS